MTQVDPRRLIPRTDELLALPAVQQARARLGDTLVRAVVRDAQDAARRGDLVPDRVRDAVLQSLAAHRTTTLRPVLNATGVVVHTNLGRAPLAQSSVASVSVPIGASSSVLVSSVEIAMNTSAAAAPRPGAASGQVIRRRAANQVRPRLRPASS